MPNWGSYNCSHIITKPPDTHTQARIKKGHTGKKYASGVLFPCASGVMAPHKKLRNNNMKGPNRNVEKNTTMPATNATPLAVRSFEVLANCTACHVFDGPNVQQYAIILRHRHLGHNKQAGATKSIHAPMTPATINPTSNRSYE